MPFPTALKSLFSTFSVLSKYRIPTMQNRLGNLMRLFTKKSCYHQGFFAVKRRAVFILGATWKALVRGWRRDCVVGGTETRSQRRKAHSRTAKCEAFHVAPRLFFRFLFLIPFTIRQQCIIYTQDFSTEPSFGISDAFFLTSVGCEKKRGYLFGEPRCAVWNVIFVLYLKK